MEISRNVAAMMRASKMMDLNFLYWKISGKDNAILPE
jgi:hypothetical protein